MLDPDVFESCFREWIGVGVVKDIIALDGKTVRGSKDGAIPPLHLVSAYATSLGLTLGQEGSSGKGNELKAIRALLDALGCQTDIAAAIVDKGGDYVLAVKANQKTLSETLSEGFETGDALGWGKVAIQSQTTVEKDHGRIETRRAVLVPQIDWLPEALRTAWPMQGALGMIETTQEKGKDEGARNLSLLRKITLAMPRLDTAYPKSSLRQRRNRASRKPIYRTELLGLRHRSQPIIKKSTK